MNNSSRRVTALLALFVITWVMLSHLPSAYAFDSTKIVLPAISDRSGYNSPELNAALLNKLRSQFRFPMYEIFLTSTPIVAPDRTALEKITNEKAADGAAVLEISYLRNRMLNGFFDDETYEETYINLTLTYFDKKTGKFGQLKANRSSTEILSIHSGALPLAVETLEEILNRLDKVFPRQFPGPRY